MTTPTDPYVLAESELGAIGQFITFQRNYGPYLRQLAGSDYAGYCDDAARLDASYAQVQNASFRQWLDLYFDKLMTTPSDAVAGMSLVFPHLYIVYAFGKACYIDIIPGDGISDVGRHFPVRASTWTSDMWLTFAHGYASIDLGSDAFGPWAGNPANGGGYLNLQIYKDPGVPRRPTSPAWKQATDDILAGWGDNPPGTLVSRASGPIVRNDAYNRAFSYELPKYSWTDANGAHDIYDPDLGWSDGLAAAAFAQQILNGWTDFPKLQQTTADVWTAQLETAHALLRAPDLTAEDYFFLLHLLFALTTGDLPTRHLAETIAQTDAPSRALPNENFINQLIYLVLMMLADPFGSRAWPSPKLQQLIANLQGMAVGTDDASRLIQTGLDSFAKKLTVAGYPVQDPFVSGNLGDRQSDTLGALDAARKTIAANLT